MLFIRVCFYKPEIIFVCASWCVCGGGVCAVKEIVWVRGFLIPKESVYYFMLSVGVWL